MTGRTLGRWGGGEQQDVDDAMCVLLTDAPDDCGESSL